MPERTTGSLSGNSATRDRLPPIASTVFLKVESRRSLRCSRRETLSWVMPSSLRQFAGAPQFLQGHLLLNQLCCAGFDFLPSRAA
jgi:hypothetical protein